MEVTVNAAMSTDGKLSTVDRRPVAISGPEDFARVDRVRAEVDAVMVGIGTVLADDPHLGVDDPSLRSERIERGDGEHPARVVVDSRARTPPTARILNDHAHTFVVVSEAAPDHNVDAIEDETTTVIPVGTERVDIQRGLVALESAGIDRLMVEGGGELIFSLFSAGVVDALSVFVAPTIIGGRTAPTLADGDGFSRPSEFSSLSLTGVERIDDGVLLHWAAGEASA